MKKRVAALESQLETCKTETETEAQISGTLRKECAAHSQANVDLRKELRERDELIRTFAVQVHQFETREEQRFKDRRGS